MGVFDEKVNFLNIILNDEIFVKKYQELFKGFNEFYAVTFVSNPKFFFDFVEKNNFKKVKLIIGIEDSLINEKFNLINPEAQLKFFKNISENILEKIKKNEIEIRYSCLGISIHSKIYILKSPEKIRIIFGSANFTEKAFKGNNQFEELIAYDSNYNSKIVEIFLQRFNEIWSKTVDYVPERIKKFQKPEIKVFSTEESLNLLKENLEKVNVVGVSSKALSELMEEAEHENQEIEYKKEVIKNSKDIINILTKKSRKGIILIKPEEVKKKQQLLSVKITRLSRKSEELDLRNELIYNEIDDLLYSGSKNEESLKLYSKKVEPDTIKRIIFKIDKFIKAYSKFTVGEEDAIKTEQRVFEAILYGFTSPFIWKIRDLHIKNKGRDTALADIPPFLIIAGQAWTGKTHLLEFLSRLLGAQGRYFHYGVRLKPANIRDYFYSEYIFPLLIDEITRDYFTGSSSSTTKGEGFIKDITNSLTGKHPCFIGTTNTEFSANMQVIRRIYYLQVNRQFDKSRKSETDDYFADVITNLDDSLFRDFSFRFAEKLKQRDNVVQNGDFLFISREIFLEYFDLINVKKPEYFSEYPLFDYYNRGSYMWRNLFLTKREGFIFQDDVIVVNPKIVFDGDRFEKEKAKKFLDIGIIIEDSVVLVLNKRKFLNFIGIKYNTFFEKIKKILGG